MSKIDSLDERLIRLLQEDAKRSSEVLAKQLKVSAATVRRRIRKLVKDDVMRVIALVDPERVGLPLAAVLAFDVEHQKLLSAMETLSKLPEVKWLSTTTGRYDIIALAQFASAEELSRFVQNEMAQIEGIKDSETFVCLHRKRTHPLLV